MFVYYGYNARPVGSVDLFSVALDDFKKLLDKNLKNYSIGDEYPLAKFLGKDVRRIQGALSQLESQLITEIGAGNFSKLSVGKVHAFGSSPTQLQYFKLN